MTAVGAGPAVAAAPATGNGDQGGDRQGCGDPGQQTTITWNAVLIPAPAASRVVAKIALALPARSVTPVIAPPAALSRQMAVSPRDAFLGRAEVVGVDEAIGRISCESIAGYPPGIPALLPGEEITAETVAYLRELVTTGARLHGASDPRFERVNVLVR